MCIINLISREHIVQDNVSIRRPAFMNPTAFFTRVIIALYKSLHDARHCSARDENLATCRNNIILIEQKEKAGRGHFIIALHRSQRVF